MIPQLEAFMEKQVTRIDLETTPGSEGKMVMVEQWYEGWTATSPCELYDQHPGPIASLLGQYERQGYAVWMCDSTHGRALRGEITRMDFIQFGALWQVRKFPYGWTAKTHPLITEQKPTDFDLEAALNWCEQHHWQIRRWPGGARAWKGEPMPVRDASTIRYLRRQVEKALQAGQIDVRNHYNLALDF
jgi:hypothetical protein